MDQAGVPQCQAEWGRQIEMHASSFLHCDQRLRRSLGGNRDNPRAKYLRSDVVQQLDLAVGDACDMEWTRECVVDLDGGHGVAGDGVQVNQCVPGRKRLHLGCRQAFGVQRREVGLPDEVVVDSKSVASSGASGCVGGLAISTSDPADTTEYPELPTSTRNQPSSGLICKVWMLALGADDLTTSPSTLTIRACADPVARSLNSFDFWTGREVSRSFSGCSV